MGSPARARATAKSTATPTEQPKAKANSTPKANGDPKVTAMARDRASYDGSTGGSTAQAQLFRAMRT